VSALNPVSSLRLLSMAIWFPTRPTSCSRRASLPIFLTSRVMSKTRVRSLSRLHSPTMKPSPQSALRHLNQGGCREKPCCSCSAKSTPMYRRKVHPLERAITHSDCLPFSSKLLRFSVTLLSKPTDGGSCSSPLRRDSTRPGLTTLKRPCPLFHPSKDVS